MERIQARDTNFLFGRWDVLRLHSVGLGYLSSNTQQKTQLNHQELSHRLRSLRKRRVGSDIVNHLAIEKDRPTIA